MKCSPIALGALALVLTAALPVAARSHLQPPEDMPAEMAPNFRAFATKCSTCHPPEKTYSDKYASEKAIKSLVARMARKPGANIGKEDQKKIITYLNWYAARKR